MKKSMTLVAAVVLLLSFAIGIAVADPVPAKQLAKAGNCALVQNPEGQCYYCCEGPGNVIRCVPSPCPPNWE